MKHPQMNDAVAAVLSGEPVRTTAKRFKIPRETLRVAVCKSPATPPAKPAATKPVAPAPVVQTVVDETPLDILSTGGVDDHQLHERAAQSFDLVDDGGDEQPAAPVAMSAEQVVDMFEGLVGVVVRVTVTSKGGEWTERLETACRFSASERNRLTATAPYVAQYVGEALATSPYWGIGLFALSAFEVVASRVALAKLATRQSPTAAAAPENEPADFEGPPMAPTDAPSIADAPAARGFGGNP
jgi:hypothetical protein